MSKKRELKVEPRVTFSQMALLDSGRFRVDYVYMEGEQDRFTPVAIVPRGRYRELCAAEKERDALRKAWPPGHYAVMLDALKKGDKP